MLNQVILVGRLTKDPELIKIDNRKRTQITLAVNRGYKNQDGIYETDFVNCILWNVVAEHTCEYCKKGDLVGVKGRIETNTVENEDETKYYVNVVVEKVTFLTSKPKEEADE